MKQGNVLPFDLVGLGTKFRDPQAKADIFYDEFSQALHLQVDGDSYAIDRPVSPEIYELNSGELDKLGSKEAHSLARLLHFRDLPLGPAIRAARTLVMSQADHYYASARCVLLKCPTPAAGDLYLDFHQFMCQSRPGESWREFWATTDRDAFAYPLEKVEVKLSYSKLKLPFAVVTFTDLEQQAFLLMALKERRPLLFERMADYTAQEYWRVLRGLPALTLSDDLFCKVMDTLATVDRRPTADARSIMSHLHAKQLQVVLGTEFALQLQALGEPALASVHRMLFNGRDWLGRLRKTENVTPELIYAFMKLGVEKTLELAEAFESFTSSGAQVEAAGWYELVDAGGSYEGWLPELHLLLYLLDPATQDETLSWED